MLASLDREKFIELLNKLGSEGDEEALSAARDLHAQVTVAQLSWDDLLVPDEVDTPMVMDDTVDHESDHLDADEADEDQGDDIVFDEDDDRDLTDEEKSEALALIDKISTLEISAGTKEELTEYKQDIEDGDFAQMDLRYLRALHGRLAK